jgi:NAD+ kinase
MKTAAIISKPGKPELQKIVPEVLGWFTEHGYRVLMDEETAVYGSNEHVMPRAEIASGKPDFALVLGGDGTLLSAARSTEVPLDELFSTLDLVHTGKCPVESRSVIECQVSRDEKCVANYFALNEVVVNKSAIARLVGFDLYVNDEFVVHYKADGVILSTPTGSTAYSLAAGGPILVPAVDAFVVTPVSPHSLTQRPLVLSDTSLVRISVESDSEQAFLTIDGQVGMPVNHGDKVVCRKADHAVRLLKVRRTFFDVLRNKLKWGQR